MNSQIETPNILLRCEKLNSEIGFLEIITIFVSMRIILLSLSLVLLISGLPVSVFCQPKTILAIFAHPDDENIIGHVLAKYARSGHKVQVLIATDGKEGTRVTSIPAGDSLGAIGGKKAFVHSEALGILPPVFLHLDRLDTKIGVRKYLNCRKQLLDEVKKHIELLQPDVLITFGPDGEYGHSEHIVTSAVVQEVLLREGWVEKYPLFFPAFTKSEVNNDDDISFVDEKYLNLKVKYSDDDEMKMFKAAKCYLTQFTESEIQELITDETTDKLNIMYFRQFIVTTGNRTDFWE